MGLAGQCCSGHSAAALRWGNHDPDDFARVISALLTLGQQQGRRCMGAAWVSTAGREPRRRTPARGGSSGKASCETAAHPATPACPAANPPATLLPGCKPRLPSCLPAPPQPCLGGGVTARTSPLVRTATQTNRRGRSERGGTVGWQAAASRVGGPGALPPALASRSAAARPAMTRACALVAAMGPATPKLTVTLQSLQLQLSHQDL